MATYGGVQYGVGIYQGIVVILVDADASPAFAAYVPGTGGGWTMAVRLWRADVNNVHLEEITSSFVSGFCDWDSTRAVQGGGQVTFRDKLLTPYADYLAIHAKMTRGDGYTRNGQIGLYAVGMPTRAGSVTGIERTYKLEDLTVILQQSIRRTAYTLAAGSDYGSGIQALITDANASLRFVVPRSGKAPSRDISIKPGLTSLDSVNQLAKSARYFPVAAGTDGRLHLKVHNRLKLSHPFATWTAADLFEAIDMVPNEAEFANAVVVIKDNPNDAPLVSVALNNDPDDPGSIVNIGREIGLKSGPVRNPQAADQESIDADAQRLLDKHSSYFQVVTAKVLMDPKLGYDQVAILQYVSGKTSWNGRYWVRAWRKGLVPEDAMMTVTMQKLTESLSG